MKKIYLLAAVMVAVSGVQAALIDVPLANAGFEDSTQNMFDGFDAVAYDIPGWKDVAVTTAAADSGVNIDNPPWYGSKSGAAAAFLRSSVDDPGIYQMTGYTIQEGDEFTVGFWAKGWDPWGSDGAEITATLFYNDVAAPAQELGSYTATALVRANASTDYAYFVSTIPANVASVGQELGIRFVNTGTDGSFATLDNVTIPEPATLGLLGAFGVGLMFIRRRFMI